MIAKFELVSQETTKMYQNILPALGRTLLHHYHPSKGHLMICKKEDKFILHNIDTVNRPNILIQDDDIVKIFDYIQSKLF